MLKNFKKNNNKGFTLVELLVVIAIIGILAVVAVPSLFKNINKANAADVVADISAIKTAVVAEYADQGKLDKDGKYSTAAEIEETLAIDGLSKSATYAMVVDEHTAKLTVTPVNDEILKGAADKLGYTLVDNATTIVFDLLGETK